MMIELVRRTFEVDPPLDATWAHLARVESWPSWAKHIKSVTLTPPATVRDRRSVFRRVALVGAGVAIWTDG